MRNFFIVLLVFCLIGCQNEKEQTLEADEFSITYPSNLSLDESGKDNTRFVLEPKNPKEDLDYIESINLVTQDDGNSALEEVATRLKNGLERVAVVDDFYKIDIHGDVAYRADFHLRHESVSRKYIQQYHKKGNRTYILTFASKADRFSEIYDEMNAVLMSFELK